MGERLAALRRWLVPAVTLAAGIMLFADGLETGSPAVAAALLAVATALAWWISPLRRGSHVPHQQAQANAAPGDVVVYWRPGCRYCAKLRRGLGPTAGDVTWVNIWADDEAAAFVAGLNDGNETVPTVVDGAGRQLPATAQAIRSRLGAKPRS